MSWHINVPPTSADKFEAALEAAHAMTGSLNPAPGETEAQVKAAKASALAMFRSGAAGDPEDASNMFGANLSGHANPGHARTAGWANDTISANVFRHFEEVRQPHRSEERELALA